MAKILIVEDDLQLSKLVRDWLKLERHEVEVVNDGQEGLNRLKAYEYDLIVLDLELPVIGGMEILREFRSTGKKTPVLILTGRSTVDDKEVGLDSGADDYLTKPFHAKELTARIRALMRRVSGQMGTVLKSGNIELDRAAFTVKRGGVEVKLVPKEFALLEFLMRNPGTVFPPDALLNRVWSNESDATVEALTTCIKRLRKKLDTEGQESIIRNVHGVGYGLRADLNN